MLEINNTQWNPFDNTEVDDATNVISQENNNLLQFSQKYDVKIPKGDEYDFKVALNASSLRKVRKTCKEVKTNKFSWSELLLGMGTMLFGAFISAIISKVQYSLEYLSIIFYTICPMVGSGCFVAYFFCRRTSIIDAARLANVVEEYIVDPDEIRDEV